MLTVSRLRLQAEAAGPLGTELGRLRRDILEAKDMSADLPLVWREVSSLAKANVAAHLAHN